MSNEKHTNGVELARDLTAIVGEQQRHDQALMRRASDWPGGGSPKAAGGNGKTVAGLVGTLAVIVVTGLAGYTRMVKDESSRRVESVEAEMRRVESRLASWTNKHEQLAAHPGAVAEMAAIRVSFREVETQFKGLREVMEVNNDDTGRRVLDAEAWMRRHNHKE